MLRKAVLISCTLLLSVSLAVFSEQSGDQKPKDIEQQLKEATCLRNVGIIITSTGLGTAVVLGGIMFFGLGSLLFCEWQTLDKMSWADEAVPILAGYTVGAVIIGPILWCSGARKIRNIRKSQIALQLRGPNWAGEGCLGGISLVYSY